MKSTQNSNLEHLNEIRSIAKKIDEILLRVQSQSQTDRTVSILSELECIHIELESLVEEKGHKTALNYSYPG